MRDKVTGARRWVVKIGSALLTADGRGLDRAAMAVWVKQMVALREQGVELVLVSSGAVAAGMSREAVAERFQISLSSTHRWVQRAAATGSAAALPMGGKKPFSLAEQADWINARIAEKPDITGRELLAELHERHVEVSYYAVWNFLDRTGLSFKKNSARQ